MVVPLMPLVGISATLHLMIGQGGLVFVIYLFWMAFTVAIYVVYTLKYKDLNRAAVQSMRSKRAAEQLAKQPPPPVEQQA